MNVNITERTDFTTTPQMAMEQMAQALIKRPGVEIVNKAYRTNSFEISYSFQSSLHFDRIVFSGGLMRWLSLSYPQSLKDVYEPVVRYVSKAIET
jgi:hypothetical protein